LNYRNPWFQTSKTTRGRIPSRCFLISILLKEKLLEQKHPDKIEPTDSNAEDGYEDTDNESEHSAFLKEGGPSYDYLRDPVYNRNQKQKDLNQTALFVKPSHSKSPYVNLYLNYITRSLFCIHFWANFVVLPIFLSFFNQNCTFHVLKCYYFGLFIEKSVFLCYNINNLLKWRRFGFIYI